MCARTKLRNHSRNARAWAATSSSSPGKELARIAAASRRSRSWACSSHATRSWPFASNSTTSSPDLMIELRKSRARSPATNLGPGRVLRRPEFIGILPLRRSLLQSRADGMEERFVTEWFEQKADGPCFKRSDSKVLIIVSRDKNSRNSIAFGGQQSMKFETADGGHHYVDDQTGAAVNLRPFEKVRC